MTVTRAETGMGRGRAAALSIPMLLLSFVMLSNGHLPTNWLRLVPFLVTYLLANIMFYRMLRTGRTDRHRAVMFVMLGITFVLSFVPELLEARGSMQLSAADMASGRTPFCHMVIPMTLIPAALTRTIIFPGSLLQGFAPIAVMFAIWMIASLVLGRGFCAWGCFFGGLEDGMSRIFRRPKLRNIAHVWTFMPYAVLAGVILTSAAALSPTYCMWLCPFKSITEFPEITSTVRAIQAGIFFSLFAGLVLVLPLLTKRRTQCGLFCPFGAFQSFTNKLDPVDIRIDRQRCSDCGLCATDCPTFSLDAESIARGGTRLSCSKCGRCVDECPRGAAAFHVKGTPVGTRPRAARVLFIYPAFLFLVTFGGGIFMNGLYRVMLLATTGHIVAR